MAATAVCGAGVTPEPGQGRAPGGGVPVGGGPGALPGVAAPPQAPAAAARGPPGPGAPPGSGACSIPGDAHRELGGAGAAPCRGGPARSPPGDQIPVFWDQRSRVPPPLGGAAPGSAPCLAQHRPHRERALAARGKRGKTPGGFPKLGLETPGTGEAATPGDPNPGEPRLPGGAVGPEPPPLPRGVPPCPAQRPAGFGRGLAGGGRCLHSKQLVNEQRGRGGGASAVLLAPPAAGHRARGSPGRWPRSPSASPGSCRLLPGSSSPCPADLGSVAASPVFSWCSPSTRGLPLGPAPFGPRRDAAGAWSRIPGP